MFCGKACNGKRSFINQILGERKAKEDDSLSVSYKVVTYSGQNLPINISDNLGFEVKKTVKKVKRLLESYDKKLIDAKEKTNLILYLFHMMKEAF